jgi:predicted alpha-1,6-mannanase (GH76 family)
VSRPGRAEQAAHAVLRRHVRSCWGLPGTALGRASAPPTPGDRWFVRWNYWWQAHLVDCLLDAHRRLPTAGHDVVARRVVRTIRLRNGGRWHNALYDDIGWLGLALQRGADVLGRRGVVRGIGTALLQAWRPATGGIPWQRGSDFLNVPANGPAAILLARAGAVPAATRIVDWIEDGLIRPDRLVMDGRHTDGRLGDVVYTYCQGVLLGARLELVLRAGRDPRPLHDLVAAVDAELAPGGVLIGDTEGDGGLFAGILARYLGQVALRLPGDGAADRACRETARRLVLVSADAAWRNAAGPDGPVFGSEWSEPVASSSLSVQLGGWMLLETAALLGGR